MWEGDQICPFLPFHADWSSEAYVTSSVSMEDVEEEHEGGGKKSGSDSEAVVVASESEDDGSTGGSDSMSSASRTIARASESLKRLVMVFLWLFPREYVRK